MKKWLCIIPAILFAWNTTAQYNIYYDIKDQYLGLSYEQVVKEYTKYDTQFFGSLHYINDTLIVTTHPAFIKDKHVFYFINDKCFKHDEICIEKIIRHYDGKEYINYMVCGLNVSYIKDGKVIYEKKLSK